MAWREIETDEWRTWNRWSAEGIPETEENWEDINENWEDINDLWEGDGS